jgi:hypothetical protein
MSVSNCSGSRCIAGACALTADQGSTSTGVPGLAVRQHPRSWPFSRTAKHDVSLRYVNRSSSGCVCVPQTATSTRR